MKTQPPDTITLVWCDRCGRTNRHSSLKSKHYNYGNICSGKIWDVVYQNSGTVE